MSASTTGAVKAPLTWRAAATSCRNRTLNASSVTSSGRITLIASSLPDTDRPRKTTPMPPAPSLSSSRYPPTDRGSPSNSVTRALPSWALSGPQTA